MSISRPKKKPKTAPGTEPAMKPTLATISGERSSGTPKTVICETAVSWRMPPSRPEQGEADDGGGGERHPLVVQVGVRLGQHLHQVELEHVRGRA